MNIIEKSSKNNWSELLQRPTKSLSSIEDTVIQIFNEIKQKGDEAIIKYTSFFDGIVQDNFKVSSSELEQANVAIPDNLKKAMQLAKNNIARFHSVQATEKVVVETTKGVTCWQEKRAIDKVGLYIPGGTAPLFSTVLMLAVPAKLAGCKEIILCTPPDKKGNINPAILYAAKLCGVTEVIKVGGIQAIAGLTFGTDTIPKVSKIFGPGNQFVTVAKQLATKYGVAIDMPAGPSELLVIADETAIPEFVASDLLSQAEHGTDSQVILVSTSQILIDKVTVEIKAQLEALPRRDIAKQALESSKMVYLKDKKEVLELVNEYGPEHLIICSNDEEFYRSGVQNAGSVFLGNYTPESAGDYASGTNHTLPTNGFSKAYSGVNLDSFLKSITFQKITDQGIKNIGNAIEVMAEAEGLQAHKNAVTLRLKSLK